MFVDDLSVLFADPSVGYLTGAVHPGLECFFCGIYVSTVFSLRVVQLPVIGLRPNSRSVQPIPAGRDVAAR